MTTLNTIIEEEKEAQKTNEDWEGKAKVQWGMQIGPNSNQFDQEKALIQICNQLLALKDEAHRKEMEEAYKAGYVAGALSSKLAQGHSVMPLTPTKEVTEELPTNH